MKDRQIFEMSGAELIEIKKKLAMFMGEKERAYQQKVFWDRLGRRLRFYPETVRIIPSNPRRFSAIPYADDEEVTGDSTPAPAPSSSYEPSSTYTPSIEPPAPAPEPIETYRSGGGGDYAGGGASGSWDSSSDSSGSSSSDSGGSSSSSGD